MRIAGILALTFVPAVAQAAFVTSVETTAERCVADAADANRRAVCARALREHGPAGLQAVLDAARDDLENRDVQHLIDSVAEQRDAWVSRLFWYRDLDRALAAGRASGRPVLSVRILGDLKDEYSCANSRFFRTLLYADPMVSARMQRDFVLHWSSERPVPVVTVDFGDGRVLKKTITGNSIHYVFGPDGRVFDAMPGLVAPSTFGDWLGDVTRRSPRDPTRALKALGRAWSKRLAEVGVEAPVEAELEVRPNAAVAMPLAVSKAVVEAPILRRMEHTDVERLDRLSSSDNLAKIAEKDPWIKLSSPTRMLMKRDTTAVGWAFESMAAGFVQTVKLDDVRNRFRMRHRTLSLIASGVTEFEALNRRVYAEIMKTPASDPWLGMHDPGDFSGLQGDGVRLSR